MIGSAKIYKLTKSLSLVKSIIYKVNKVISIVIRGTSTFKKHTKIYTKNKNHNYFSVTFVYFHWLLVT